MTLPKFEMDRIPPDSGVQYSDDETDHGPFIRMLAPVDMSWSYGIPCYGETQEDADFLATELLKAINQTQGG